MLYFELYYHASTTLAYILDCKEVKSRGLKWGWLLTAVTVQRPRQPYFSPGPQSQTRSRDKSLTLSKVNLKSEIKASKPLAKGVVKNQSM